MILIAGGTGHLGSRLVPLLVARGLSVRVLTRDPGRASAGPAGAERVRGDVRVPDSLAAAMAGVDTVVSAITGFGPGGDGPRAVDRDGNRNLIRAAEAAGATRYVLLSMHGAAPDHRLELYRMKHRAEELLRESGLAWTIIRPTVFMELWLQLLCEPILQTGKARVFGAGRNPINFVSVDDLARVVERATVDPRLGGQVLDVGGPENLTLGEVVRTFTAIVGRPASVSHVPVLAMRAAALALRRVKPDIARLIEAGVLMDRADMTLDPAELRSRYPGIPLTTLEMVVRRHYGVTASADRRPGSDDPMPEAILHQANNGGPT